MRYALAVLALAACSDDRGPVTDGISRVHVHFNHSDDGWYFDLGYTVRLVHTLPTSAMGLMVKAACQVGPDRFVSNEPEMARAEPGVAVELESHPFVIGELHEQPSLCDIAISEYSFSDRGAVLGEFCMTDKLVRGPCPPNQLTGDGGPTGISAVLLSIHGEDKDSIGFPAHLTVRYKYTAHRDMPKGAYFVRTTSCGTGSDSTWHSELANLRAGESMLAGQNTYHIGRPRPGTKCETSFGYSPIVDGAITPIAKFCHVDDTITPCG